MAVPFAASPLQCGQCTGQHQKLAVTVFSFGFPGWQLGDAVVSVTACAQGCDTATREIVWSDEFSIEADAARQRLRAVARAAALQVVDHIDRKAWCAVTGQF